VLDFLLAVDYALGIYAWLAFAAMVLVWLKGFKIVGDGTYGVAFIGKCLNIVLEPALRPIRVVLPNLGGIDGTPFVLLLIIMAVRYAMALYLFPKLV
jgi:YggT family protein